MIVITGDLIDSRNTDLEVALNFVTEAMKVAPCYFVTGNHEERVSEYKTLKEEMEQMGVVVLENEAMSLEREGESITLLGVDDPSFQTDYLFGDSESVMSSVLKQMTEGIDTYTILLSHRPELFEVYAAWEVDLVFSVMLMAVSFVCPGSAVWWRRIKDSFPNTMKDFLWKGIRI